MINGVIKKNSFSSYSSKGLIGGEGPILWSENPRPGIFAKRIWFDEPQSSGILVNRSRQDNI